MSDRPPAPASRVGRPRMRSVHQSPYVAASKVGRPRSKSVYQPKVKELKKNPTKQKSVKTTPPLEQDVLVVIDPKEQPEDLDFLIHQISYQISLQ